MGSLSSSFVPCGKAQKQPQERRWAPSGPDPLMLQTRIKNRLIRRGIVALALLATLPGAACDLFPASARSSIDLRPRTVQKNDGFSPVNRGKAKQGPPWALERQRGPERDFGPSR